MTITLENLCREIDPKRTALLFGAGSSIPSGAPSGEKLAREISEHFGVAVGKKLSLSDVASLIELKFDRRPLVDHLRERIYKLVPSGGILDIPRYPWREIYTTNYDNLLERSYARSDIEYTVISANYEFDKESDEKLNIFKIHGTIDKDKCYEIYQNLF